MMIVSLKDSATSRPLPIILEAFTSSKSRILSFALDPAAQPQSVGIKAAAWKFVQKVLLAGTRATAADPRVKLSRLDGADIQLQTRGGTDPNISMISRDSPFDATELEEEANLLRTQLVTQMYSSRCVDDLKNSAECSDPAILHPIFHTLPALCKNRPALAPLLVSSITSWTPAALHVAERPHLQIRAVDKTLKTVMGHLIR